jgi:hypothetical protein
MTSIKVWIEENINNGYIRYFEYDNFKIDKNNEIGRGSFGKVEKANLANTGLVALKTLFNKNSNDELDETDDEFVKEVGITFYVVQYISLLYK